MRRGTKKRIDVDVRVSMVYGISDGQCALVGLG